MMKQELDEQLCREFPNLYRNRHGLRRETCMRFGFSCGDGWFDIIYELSKKLEALILEMPEEERESCCAAQVKEKFGGLRFYMDGSTDEIWKLAGEAESKSYEICEDCGSEEGVENLGHGGNWLRSLCRVCSRKMYMSRSNSRLELLVKHGITATQEEWDRRRKR